MLHVLYDSGVHGGEAVTGRDTKELTAYRVKLRSGRYVIVLADSEKAAQTWADEQEAAAGVEPVKPAKTTAGK